MPRVSRPLSQEAATISERIVREVSKQVVKFTGFTETFEVIMGGSSKEGMKQLHNLFAQDESNDIRTPYKNYLFIEFEEKYVDDAVALSRWQTQYMPDLFTDKAHGIHIVPHYAVAVVELTLRLRCNDFSVLNRYTNAVRFNHGNRNLNYQHDVDYDYKIPDDYIAFIVDAHELIEGEFPDGKTMSEYFGETFRSGIQKRSTLNGEEHEIIMVERQTEVKGMVTDESFYNAKEISDGIFEVAIPYRFEYRKPLALTMKTPAFIRNSRIDMRYVNAWVPVTQKALTAESPFWMRSRFDPENPNRFFIGDGGSRMVEWDEWFPENYLEDTQTVTILPIQVDPSTPSTCLCLYDIPPRFMSSAIITYLKEHRSFQGNYRESLVVVEVFAVGEEEEKLIVTMDEQLNLISYKPLDPKKRHYLRISLMKDLAIYSSKATKDLLAKPDIAMELFKLYDPEVTLTHDRKLADEKLPATVTKGRYRDIPSLLYAPSSGAITGKSFTIWLHKLSATNDLFLNLNPYWGRSVGIYNIIARRK